MIFFFLSPAGRACWIQWWDHKIPVSGWNGEETRKGIFIKLTMSNYQGTVMFCRVSNHCIYVLYFGKSKGEMTCLLLPCILNQANLPSLNDVKVSPRIQDNTWIFPTFSSTKDSTSFIAHLQRRILVDLEFYKAVTNDATQIMGQVGLKATDYKAGFPTFHQCCASLVPSRTLARLWLHSWEEKATCRLASGDTASFLVNAYPKGIPKPKDFDPNTGE